jgi:hypothetical protein
VELDETTDLPNFERVALGRKCATFAAAIVLIAIACAPEPIVIAPAAGFGELPGNPFGTRMGRYAEP